VAMPVHKSSIELFFRSLDDALVGCISIFIDLTELTQLGEKEVFTDRSRFLFFNVLCFSHSTIALFLFVYIDILLHFHEHFIVVYIVFTVLLTLFYNCF
jgi:hypothetical protein